MRIRPSIVRRSVSVLALVAVVSPALAQDDGRDWDVIRDDRKKVIVASTVFDNGIGIAVRCSRDSYDALIVGLPEARGETRTLQIAFDDEPLHDETWNVATETTVAVGSLPAPFARRLRQGGQLQVQVPRGAEDGRNLRYVLELPASNAAIDETLTACDRPLVDPRDAELVDIGPGGLPNGLTWERAPRPSYPMGTRYARGFAVLTCLNNPDGSLRDCVVETQHPGDGFFGEAALRSTRNARLTSTDDPDAALPTRRVGFRVNFYIQGYQPRS